MHISTKSLFDHMSMRLRPFLSCFCNSTSLQQCRISKLIRPCMCNRHLVITPYGLTWLIVLQTTFDDNVKHKNIRVWDIFKDP
ncbi:hypothetical protein OIU78_021365 [Salix suchowensis]|nr:hypothetical protein OIU78_021365 [Salix suchowensis]